LTTTLLQVAYELATANPSATADDISDVIINTIESEEALDIILRILRLPTSREISIARMKMSRSSKKDAKRIENKLELAALIDKIKSAMQKDTASSVLQRTSSNGSRVVAESIAQQLVDGNSRLPRRPSIMAVNKRVRHILPVRSSYDYYLDLPREPEKDEPIQYIVSLDSLLDDISAKTMSGQILLFDDIAKVLLVLEFSDDQTFLVRINKILQSDIELRNRSFRIDCVQALYEGEESVPMEMRTRHPEPQSVKQRINELIRAILLHEQGRLHREASLSFLGGQKTYADYVDTSKRCALNASRLYPVEP
jgi:hypothetical protein